MQYFGGFTQRLATSRQETAHFDVTSTGGFSDSDQVCKRAFVAVLYSKRAVAFCQHRYPSPRRSASFQSRPAPHSLHLHNICATNRHYALNYVESGLECADLLRVNQLTESKLSCSKLPGSLLQPPCLAWPVVWKMTQSARSWAPAQAVSQARCSTTIAPQALSLVALSAHYLTTSNAFAAQRRSATQETQHNRRRRGLSPAAFLRSKD